MKFSKIIKEIESSNARLFKESVILEQMKLNNDIFFQGLDLAYNKLLTFGVKKFLYLRIVVMDLIGKSLRKSLIT